jgi:hypothetical protein
MNDTTRATNFDTFYGQFCDRIVVLLGGPDKSKDFFNKHQLAHLRIVAARHAFFDGVWGYTARGAADEWFRLILKPSI